MNHYQALQLAHRWLIAARTADKIGGDELAEDMANIENALTLHPDQIGPGEQPIPYEDLYGKFVRTRAQFMNEVNMTSLLAQAIRDMLDVPKEGTDIGEPIERARNLAEASKNGRACPTLLDEAVDRMLAWDAGDDSLDYDRDILPKLKEARAGAPTLLPARDSLWAATAAIKFLVAVLDECGKQVMLDLGTVRKIETARELAQKLETA